MGPHLGERERGEAEGRDHHRPPSGAWSPQRPHEWADDYAIPRPCPGCAQGEEITAETCACHINAAALNDHSNTHKTDNQANPPPAPEVFAAG